MKKTVWVVGSILLVSLLLLTLLSSTPVKKPPLTKIGILLANDLRQAKIEGLESGLKTLGYENEEDITYQVLNAQNDLAKLPVLAANLIEARPNVLVAAGAVEAQSLKTLTAKMSSPLPVVFLGALSPTELGLVGSTAHPGGNITGLNNYHLELTPKRLELLHRLLPSVHKVAVLGDTRVPFFVETQKSIHDVAEKFALTINTYTVSTPEEGAQVIGQMSQDRIEAALLLPGFFLETSTKQIVDLAIQKNIPVFGVYPGDVEQGCLASYGVSYKDQGEQSAHLITKILQGESPGDIPVETPDKLVFAVNLQTARRLGIRPAPSILSFADKVIQP